MYSTMIVVLGFFSDLSARGLSKILSAACILACWVSRSIGRMGGWAFGLLISWLFGCLVDVLAK